MDRPKNFMTVEELMENFRKQIPDFDKKMDIARQELSSTCLMDQMLLDDPSLAGKPIGLACPCPKCTLR